MRDHRMTGDETVDRTLLVSILILIAVGLIFVCSASYIFAERRYGDGLYFFRRQVVFSLIGIAGMIAVGRINYRRFSSLVVPGLIVAIVALSAVFVPGIGTLSGGSRRWINLHVASFQPSELTKLVLVLYLAKTLDRKQNDLHDFAWGVLPACVVSGVLMALVIFEPDFGTTVMIGSVLLVMLFMAGVRVRHLLVMLVMSIISAGVVLFQEGYRKQRLLAFLDPWQHAQGSGFQIIQSLLAFQSGGIWGRGLGDGRQKLFFLPEAHTDFILAVFAEEVGLVGMTLLIIIFAIVVWRGFVISRIATDRFGSNLAIGIVTWIGLQTIINMAVVMGMLPTKGLPLPFISYGGTSLVISCIAVGILLSVSRYGRRVG